MGPIIARLEAELGRRFRRLQASVRESLVANDALGLVKPIAGKTPGVAVINTQAIIRIQRDEAIDPKRFAFVRSQDKVRGFMNWIREQEKTGVLGVMQGTPIEYAAESAWTNTYIESAYVKGVKDAGEKLRKAGADVADTWIQNAFFRPIHADRLGLAFTRVFSELEGITDTMDQQISRVLAQGLAEGQGPAVIARRINERVDKIGITRARVLARTEVMNAHANGTLNSFQEAGIEGVEVEAEWLTAADPCPICEALAAGGPYTLEEARGMIPAHPNCRCAWAPKVVNGTGIELR